MTISHNTAKVSAVAIAAITGITLLLRIYLAAQDQGSIVAAASYLTQFFTILTNLAVFIAMLYHTTGRTLSQKVLVPLVASIVGVGLIYHMILAHLWSPQGLSMIADQGVHTVVPLLTFLWWLVFSNMSEVSWKDCFRVIIWPLAYVSYALVRAIWSDFYPYPFINLTELGATKLVLNLVGLSLVFIVLGVMLLLIARWVSRLKKYLFTSTRV